MYAGVDAVMQHYTDKSVLVTRDATYRGLAEIRQFFTALLTGPTAGFPAAFKLKRQEAAGEMGYIVWEAQPWFPLATDTYVVRDGKFVQQTFTACNC
jgi:hypothetical protein